MKLILVNKSLSQFSYLSGTIIVPPNSNTDISPTYWYGLANDAQFLSDISFNNIYINDGVTDYKLVEASMFLQQIEDKVTIGNGFGTSTDIVAVPGTSEVPFFLLRNPVESNKRVRLYRLRLGVDSGKISTVKMYLKPAITGAGTSLVPVNLKQTVATAPSGIATVHRLPAASSFGLLLDAYILPPNVVPLTFEFQESIVLEPGVDFLITFTNSANNTFSFVTARWIEV